MIIKPAFDNILLLLIHDEEATKSGLILPKSERKKEQPFSIGRVMDIGPDCTQKIEVDQIVYIRPHDVYTLYDGEKNVYIVRESAVFAVKEEVKTVN